MIFRNHTETMNVIYYPSALLIPLSSFFIFSIGFIPLIGFIMVIKYLVPFLGAWFYVLLPFLIYLCISILVFSQMFLSALIIKLFHVYYEPGSYRYYTKEKNALKWMIIATIYTPIRKTLEMIPMGRWKLSYLRFMGMTIGRNTLVGGAIKDPCVTSFGNHCTIGEYAIIYGHIHNFEKNTIMIDPVHIGDNCVIGAGAIIMPGVILEDNVTVAAGALVPKGKRLTSGNIYVGIPAKKL